MRSALTFALSAAIAAALPAQVQTGSMTGLQSGSQFGTVIVPFHDIDNDGTVDLLIGCPAWDSGTATNTGRVELRSGRTGALLRTNNGTNGNDYYGSSIAVLDDLNGDHVPEYLIGVPQADNGGTDSGAIKVFSGATGGLMRNQFLTENGGMLGMCVLALPDINGDGIGDYAASAPNNTNVYPVGRLLMWSGSNGNLIRAIYGYTSSAMYATRLALVGDVDGDGRPDLAVGSPTESMFGSAGAGLLEIFTLSTMQSVLRINGQFYHEHVGETVVALGDIDGDGRDEFAVGAPDAGNGTVRVYRGDGTVIRSHNGSANGGRFGLGLACVGDVDFDGISDYGIGEPLAGGSGDAWIRSGRTGAVLAHVTNGSSGAFWGRTIAAVGDTDHDGFDEFAISMPNQGYGELRCYSLSSPSSSTTFGTSCGLTSVAPQLRLQSGGAVGTNLTVRFDIGTIASGFGVMMVGWSNTSHSGTPLPLALGSYGLPGCELLVAPAANLAVTQNRAIGYVSLGTPQGAAMVGLTLYCQYALFQPTTIAFTNGLGVRFGTPF